MIELHLEQKGKGRSRSAVLRIGGEATVEHAGEIQEVLLKGLADFKALRLDCSAVTEMDFYAIQLFCSAHRTAVAREKELVFEGNLPGKAVDSISVSGFLRHRGCHLCPEGTRCLWV